MSIHVTVSSNPVCISRSKVLLTDLEQAKKIEWNRRRKLRLQQVRQQSRDLANNLRKKCNAEKKLSEQQEKEENEIELKHWQAKQLEKLQEAYEQGLAAVGTAHRSAFSEIENDENVKEKQELRDALAKARGDLARERAKLLSTSIKPSVSVKCISSDKGKANKVTAASTSQALDRNKNKTIPSKSTLKQKPGVEYSKKIEIKENVPTECTISSPGHNIKLQFKPKAIRSIAPKINRRQRSHSPSRSTVTIKDVPIDSSDDSEDSNVTWPPRSTRTSKIDYSPVKVRLYNHDQRISKEYFKSCTSVTHIDSQENEEMEKYIEEEEEAVAKKSEFDAVVKKRSDTRGQHALRKERLEREFKTLEQQYSEVDKQQKIARIFEFPYPFKETKERKLNKENESKNKFSKAIPTTNKEPDKAIEDKTTLSTSTKSVIRNIVQDLNKCFEVAALKDKKADKKPDGCAELSISPNPFTLKKLIKDLEKERDLLLNSSIEKSVNDLEKRLSPKKNDVKEDSKIGKQNENVTERLPDAGVKRNKEKPPHPLEVNVITKPLCNCCDQCTCPNRTSLNERESNNENFDQNQTITNENDDKSSPILKHSMRTSFGHDKSQKSQKIIENRESLDKSESNDVQVNESSSSSDTEVVSTICGKDIKITVKVKEKNKSKLTSDDQPLIENENRENYVPWRDRLSGQTDNINSSSSYCSPPSKLSPAQESILNSILLKMCLKNNNPELHKYIKRLLFMNKSKIDDLAVSSPSEVSIQSDLFNNINLDNITGTYQLNEPSSSRRKHVKIVQSDGVQKSKTAKKKVIQLNSSSEDSNVQERSPLPKETTEKIKNLAEEYSLRLKDLVQMLNKVSPRVLRGSELNDNYDSSSYVYPPLDCNRFFERFSSSNGADSNFISLFENGTTGANFENIYDSNFQTENQQGSAYGRNNITSLGLPFELLPKPFTLEVEDKGESLPKTKPPASGNKYRVEGHLPHELSAIPEVSSYICSRTLGQQSTNDEKGYSDLNEEYLSDTDLLDLSSIKDTTPIKTLKRQSITESQESIESMQCIHIDSSSLSIVSHVTNESQIEIKTDTDNNLDTSSSDYIEQVFRSLGVGWALSTLKKTRESRQKDNNTSSSPSYNDSYVMIERKRSKSNSRTKVNRSHSTPKKLVESQKTPTTSGDEDLHKKFNALKNDNLTPPDLTLKIPNLGSYK